MRVGLTIETCTHLVLAVTTSPAVALATLVLILWRQFDYIAHGTSQ